MVLGLSSDLKIKLGQEKDCIQSVTVEWPASKVQEKIEAAFREVQAQAKIQGFRPGKAPLDYVRQNYQEVAYSRAQDTLMRDGVSEAIRTKKINAIQTPVVQTVQFSPEKPFSFEFHVEVAPVVKPDGYKGMKLTKKVNPITTADIDKAIHDLANANARLIESKDESLTMSHFAVIDYEGFMDAKPIEGAKAENFLLDMTAPQSITGLAEGLAGMKAGEQREVDVSFPEDSPSKELAGKKGSFKVTLKAIKQKQVPALDDEFAKDLGLESFQQLSDKIRLNLEKERDQAGRRELETQVIDHLLKENTFSIPPSHVERQVEHLTDRQKSHLSRQGISEEDLKKFLENTKVDTRRQAEKDVRLAYILNAIAEIEKIDVSEEEITTKINEIVSQSDPKQREAIEKMLHSSYRDRLRSEGRESKIFEWLIGNAKVKETSGGS